MEVKDLFAEELRLASPPCHSLTRKRTVRLADLEKEPFIVMKEKHCLGVQVLNFCERRDLKPTISFCAIPLDKLNCIYYSNSLKNVQFSIAVHILTGLAQYRGRVPSRIVSNSVNTTPSFVRRVLAKLSKAGLVKTSTGRSGFCLLAKDPRRITLLDIYRAVEGPKAIAIHDYPTLDSCVVSRRIKPSLKRIQDVVERSVQKSLAGITLASVLREVEG